VQTVAKTSLPYRGSELVRYAK